MGPLTSGSSSMRWSKVKYFLWPSELPVFPYSLLSLADECLDLIGPPWSSDTDCANDVSDWRHHVLDGADYEIAPW